MKDMHAIIPPVGIDLIKAELTPDKKFMDTNKGHNEIYLVTWHDSPNTVTEIGRLREIAFREAGGATGLPCDLDEFDKMEKPYKQLIVWDPDAEAIIGGYRYLMGSEATFYDNGQPRLASSHQFHFSDRFIKDYLPYTMELGRSFVAQEYQSSKAGAKAIFALDNLWDGIASLVYTHPKIMYFFGKVTVYPSFDPVSKDLLMHFLWKHFGDKDELVRPYEMLMPSSDPRLMDLILNKDDFKEDLKLLKEAVRRRGTNIPPLFNSYMNTSPTLLMMGTALNEEMSNIEDTAMLVCYNEMYEEKKARHIESYVRYRLERMRTRFPLLDPEMEAKIVAKWDTRKQSWYERIKSRLGR